MIKRILFVVLLLSFLASCQPPCACSPPLPIGFTDAGPDQTVSVGATVNLNGYVGAAYFLWSFAEKPSSSQATLTQAETLTPSFVADVAGTYLIKLESKASDGEVKGSDAVMIIAN